VVGQEERMVLVVAGEIKELKDNLNQKENRR